MGRKAPWARDSVLADATEAANNLVDNEGTGVESPNLAEADVGVSTEVTGTIVTPEDCLAEGCQDKSGSTAGEVDRPFLSCEDDMVETTVKTRSEGPQLNRSTVGSKDVPDEPSQEETIAPVADASLSVKGSAESTEETTGATGRGNTEPVSNAQALALGQVSSPAPVSAPSQVTVVDAANQSTVGSKDGVEEPSQEDRIAPVADASLSVKDSAESTEETTGATGRGNTEPVPNAPALALGQVSSPAPVSAPSQVTVLDAALALGPPPGAAPVLGPVLGPAPHPAPDPEPSLALKPTPAPASSTAPASVPAADLAVSPNPAPTPAVGPTPAPAVGAAPASALAQAPASAPSPSPPPTPALPLGAGSGTHPTDGNEKSTVYAQSSADEGLATATIVDKAQMPIDPVEEDEANREALEKGLKIDTSQSLGYTPVVRGSIVFRDSNPKSPVVIDLMDEDEQKEIVSLLEDDAVDLKRLTASVTLETESGTKVVKQSEEAYWQKRLKKAVTKNAEAKKLLKTQRNNASFASMALMLPLPVAERAVVLEALNNPGDDDAIVARAVGTGAKPYITRSDLKSLLPGNWLKGDIIDYYMYCLRERSSKAVSKKKSGIKTCHYFRSDFYKKVFPELGNDAPYEYDQVKKWTKRGVPFNSIFRCDALFFPCNIKRQHWVLVVAFIKDKTIQVFDSLRANHADLLLAIFRYLMDEHRSLYFGEELPDQKEWKLYAETPVCPGQTNGNDCGIFVCMFADYIANGWPLIFNQSHINTCRERIALGILRNCAVTTQATAVMVDELWNMRDSIIFAVEMYRPQLTKYLDEGELPIEDSMSLYLVNPSKTEYGKKSYKEQFRSDNLVTFNRIEEKKHVLLSISPEESSFVKAEMEASRLSRKASRAERSRRIKEAPPDDRKHLKRELKSEELLAFIESVEKRLFQAQKAMAGQDEKKQLDFDYAVSLAAVAKQKRTEIPDLASMPQRERSFAKLERVSDSLIWLTEKLRKRMKVVEVGQLPLSERPNKEMRFDSVTELRRLFTSEWLEKVSHVPQARRAQMKQDYASKCWTQLLKDLKGKGLSYLLPVDLLEFGLSKDPTAPPGLKEPPDSSVNQPTAPPGLKEPPDYSLTPHPGPKEPPEPSGTHNYTPSAFLYVQKPPESAQYPSTLKDATDVGKKRLTKLPTHPAGPAKAHRNYGDDDLELEDLTQFETEGTLAEFAGIPNPNVDDYFGALKANRIRREEFSAASRRNRAKQRRNRTPEQVVELLRKQRQAKLEEKIAAKVAREKAKKNGERLFAAQTLEIQRRESVREDAKKLIPLLNVMAGDDPRAAKKAKTKFERLFPSTASSENAEKKYIAELRKTLPADKWLTMKNGVKEAGEIQRVRYKFAGYTFKAHFMGMKRSPTDPSGGEEIKFINPAWIRYHFDEKFVAAVVEFANVSNKWVEVPIGCSRGPDVFPPLLCRVWSLECHYPQGDKDYCMFYSFASALYYKGWHKESEKLRMAAHVLENKDRVSQIAGLKSALSQLLIFHECPIVWGQRKKRYKRFDIFTDTSNDPTLIIPWGGDGGVQHAVTIVGHYIFDSTSRHALHLTQQSLDWCCNTQLGYKGVHLAIRFPLLPDKKPATSASD